MAQEIDHLSSPRPPSADNTSIGDNDQTHELTIDDAFGGWPSAQQRFFADGGIFDQIYLR